LSPAADARPKLLECPVNNSGLNIFKKGSRVPGGCSPSLLVSDGAEKGLAGAKLDVRIKS
jgi:hypothetical protein